jgi:hypothetical protein
MIEQSDIIYNFRLLDEGEVTQYAGKEYDVKLINGNIELHERL